MKCHDYKIKIHHLFKADFLNLIEEVKQLKKTLSSEEYKNHFKVKWLSTLKQLIKDIIPSNPEDKNYFCSNKTSILKDFPHIRRKKIQERYRLFFVFSTNNLEIGYIWFNGEDTLRKYGDKNDPYNIMLKNLKNGTIPNNAQEIISQCESYSEPLTK